MKKISVILTVLALSSIYNIQALGWLRRINNKTPKKMVVVRPEDGKSWVVEANDFTVPEGGGGKDYISWCMHDGRGRPMEVRLESEKGKLVKQFCQGKHGYARSCSPENTKEDCNEGYSISTDKEGYAWKIDNLELGLIIEGDPDNPRLRILGIRKK